MTAEQHQPCCNFSAFFTFLLEAEARKIPQFLAVDENHWVWFLTLQFYGSVSNNAFQILSSWRELCGWQGLHGLAWIPLVMLADASVLHMLGLSKAQRELGREMLSFITLFPCAVDIPVVSKASPDLLMCRTRGKFGIGGSDSGKCLTKCHIVVLVFVIPSVPPLTEELRSRWEVELWREVLMVNLLLALLCWKFRDGHDASAEPEPCGQRTGVSLLENVENHPLSFLCFHKCPENWVWKPLKNPSSRGCLVFSKPALFLFRPKRTSKFVLS